MVGCLYITLALLSIFMFGSGVHSSILEDVADECANNECPWESITLRFLFLIVIACHIPFIFFSGKEGVLIIIDEIDRRSISKALDIKMKAQRMPVICEVTKSEINHEEGEDLPTIEEVPIITNGKEEFTADDLQKRELSKSSPNVFKTQRRQVPQVKHSVRKSEYNPNK